MIYNRHMKELSWKEYILKTSRIFKFAKRGLLEALKSTLEIAQTAIYVSRDYQKSPGSLQGVGI